MRKKPSLSTEAENPWENTIPIIKTNFHTDAYVCDSINEPFDYAELYHTLHNANEHETFTLHINTPGGMIDSAFMVIDAIKTSKATVTAHLTGTVASAGTMIALACDKLTIADHTSFMIHNYSAGMMGKGHEMKARQEFTDKSLNDAFKTFYRGFLTDTEMTEVIDGKDMWMGKEEVVARWDTRCKLLRKEVIPRISDKTTKPSE